MSVELVRAIQPFVNPSTGRIVDPNDVYLATAALPVAYPSLFADAALFAVDAGGALAELTG